MYRHVAIRIVILCAAAGALATTLHAQYKVMAYLTGKPSTPVEPGIIAQSRGGYLLTTASDQSSDLHGVAFRVTTSGALTVLHEFDKAEGDLPSSGLTLGRDGRFYGTTVFGGPDNSGSVFQMTPDGIIKTLHQFTSASDGHPAAPPVQSMYGDFYGTTYGDDNDPDTYPGTIYKIDGSGHYTLLHAFDSAEGANPLAPLVQDATNFWFYGTAMHGGPSRVGTIFRVSSRGQFEVLYNFDEAHGGYPVALIQANDGDFYGMTYLGGVGDNGVVFRMTRDHQVTVLHFFAGGSDGGGPVGGLLQGSDGYLYGTAGSALFRMNTSGGEYKVLHTFERATGEGPVALVQHTDGFLYGTTNGGGEFNGVFYGGVVFRYDAGLTPFVTFLNSYGRVGMTVQLLGDGFRADSQVLFNGVAAQVTKVEPAFLKVVVPAGATSGPITVTTTKGTLKSNKIFVVRP